MKTLLAIFDSRERLINATISLHGLGYNAIDILSPVPIPELYSLLEHAHGHRVSPVKYFSFFGVIVGALAGFTLAAGAAVIMLLPTGGLPIIPWPPYLLIGYELAILLGVLATLVGFFICSGLPAISDRDYHHRCSCDCFALVVCQDIENIEQQLQQLGAIEIQSAGDD